MQTYTLDYLKRQNPLFFKNAHPGERYLIKENTLIVSYTLSFSDGASNKCKAFYNIGITGHLKHTETKIIQSTPPL